MSFREPSVWKGAIRLCKIVYALTTSFPDKEKFGRSSRMQRVVVSVTSNIAEGAGRQYKKEFVQFLYHIRGSLYELMTQIEIGKEVGYIPETHFTKLLESCDHLARQINALITSLKSRPKTKN